MGKRVVYRFERELVTLYYPNRGFNIMLYTPGDEENAEKMFTDNIRPFGLLYFKSRENAQKYAETVMKKQIEEYFEEWTKGRGYPDKVYTDGRLMKLKYEPYAYEYNTYIELEPGAPLAYENLDKEFKYWWADVYYYGNIHKTKYAYLPYREGEPKPEYAILQVIKLED